MPDKLIDFHGYQIPADAHAFIVGAWANCVVSRASCAEPTRLGVARAEELALEVLREYEFSGSARNLYRYMTDNQCHFDYLLCAGHYRS